MPIRFYIGDVHVRNKPKFALDYLINLKYSLKKKTILLKRFNDLVVLLPPLITVLWHAW